VRKTQKQRLEGTSPLAAVRPALLNEGDAATYVGKSQSWLRQRRAIDVAAMKFGDKPTGPAWVLIQNSIAYRMADLDAWVQANVEVRGRAPFRGSIANASAAP
jgi:hypothetical protein